MRQIASLKSRPQQPWLLLFIFSVITLLVYGNTVDAKFAGDFYGWINRFQQYGAGGLMRGFDAHSSLYVYHTLLFIVYKLFGLASWPWFILFAGLHVLNGYLLSRLAYQLIIRFHIRHPWLIAFAAALFFLVSPKQNEPVVWGAALHYVVCTFLVLSILMAILRYERTKERTYYWGGLLAGLAAVYTTEIAQVIPLVMILFYGIVYHGLATVSFGGFTKRWVLPQLLFGTSFFVANYVRMGDWIGHYGAEVHLQFPISAVTGNAFIYLADYIIFLKQMPYKVVHAAYQFFHTPWIGWLLLALGIGLLILTAMRLARLRGPWRLLLFSAGAFFLLLGPVLNLYYYHLLTGMNDLYGYAASPFIYLAVALSLFWMLPRNAAIAMSGLYLVVALLFSNYGSIRWQESGWVREGLLASYEEYDSGQTVLLNMPNSVKGAYAFKAQGVFPMSYKVTRGTDTHDKIWEIASYNMRSLTDGVAVAQLDSNRLKVNFIHGGSWWWVNGKGATDYETDHYEVDFSTSGSSYVLTFTGNQYKDRRILYQDGLKWREFDMR